MDPKIPPPEPPYPPRCEAPAPCPAPPQPPRRAYPSAVRDGDDRRLPPVWRIPTDPPGA